VLDLGTALDVVTKRGAFFSYGDVRLGQGRENAKEFLKQNPELCDEIEKAVREHAMGSGLPFTSSYESTEGSTDEAPAMEE